MKVLKSLTVLFATLFVLNAEAKEGFYAQALAGIEYYPGFNLSESSTTDLGTISAKFGGLQFGWGLEMGYFIIPNFSLGVGIDYANLGSASFAGLAEIQIGTLDFGVMADFWVLNSFFAGVKASYATFNYSVSILGQSQSGNVGSALALAPRVGWEFLSLAIFSAGIEVHAKYIFNPGEALGSKGLFDPGARVFARLNF